MCDYVIDLNDWNSCSHIAGLSYSLPGEQKVRKLDGAMNPPKSNFGFDYCSSHNVNSCDYTPLFILPKDLTNWMNSMGYYGSASIQNQTLTSPGQLIISQTNIKFYSLFKVCEGWFKKFDFKVIKNCYTVNFVDLNAYVVGPCSNPVYQWNNGATTSSIRVRELNKACLLYTSPSPRD